MYSENISEVIDSGRLMHTLGLVTMAMSQSWTVSRI